MCRFFAPCTINRVNNNKKRAAIDRERNEKKKIARRRMSCRHRCRDKMRCDHACCKVVDDVIIIEQEEEENEEMLSGDLCYERGRQCLRDGDYDAALMWFRKGIDLFVHHHCYYDLSSVTRKLEWSEEQRQTLRDEAESGDASAMFLLGDLMFYYGDAGFATELG